MFLLAYADELEAEVIFPEPTHWFDLPRGYEGSRQVALKHVLNGKGHRGQMSFIGPESAFFTAPPRSSPKLPPAITAAEALSDLPLITSHLDGTLKRGARHFDQFTPYRCGQPSGVRNAHAHMERIRE
jgi:DNA (cytosine-5)-methyltransferase 1